jgi:hypothetical protein
MMPLHYIDSFRDKAEIEVTIFLANMIIYRARFELSSRTTMKALVAPRKML